MGGDVHILKSLRREEELEESQEPEVRGSSNLARSIDDWSCTNDV